MAHEPDWQAVHRRLQGASSVHVTQFEVGTAISDDDRELLEVLKVAKIPKVVMRQLEAANGVKLLWHGKLGGRKIQGSLNILPYLQASIRAGATETSEPLEGVLWDDEFPENIKKQLKEMTIFEAISGKSAYLAYDSADSAAHLALIDGDRIDPLVPDFEKTVSLLAQYAGADGLREHLVHRDWQQRIAEDAALVAVAAL